MSRRKEMIACLIDAGEILKAESALSDPAQGLVAAWSAQVAAALAAAHMDDALESWSQARSTERRLTIGDTLNERLTQLRSWQSE